MGEITRLDRFNPRKGLDRGRSKFIEASWYLVKRVFFLSSIPWSYSIKSILLRLYGAQAGHGLIIKPRVNIHFPWKLILGDYVWLGEEVFLLNLELIHIEAHCCISQRAFLCTGNHDFHDPSFGYRNSPIFVSRGAWIGAGSIICPGVTIGAEGVVVAGSVVTSDVASNTIVAGNPAIPKRSRWPVDEQSG